MRRFIWRCRYMLHGVRAWRGSINLWKTFWYFSGEWEWRDAEPCDACQEDIYACL